MATKRIGVGGINKLETKQQTNFRTEQKNLLEGVTTAMTKLLLVIAKQLFSKHKKLTSFGWKQWDTKDLFHRESINYHSLDTPDINGNDGSSVYGSDDILLQSDIAEALSQLDRDLLLIAFQKNKEICVYSDQTLEINTYDPYESFVEQFQESQETSY